MNHEARALSALIEHKDMMGAMAENAASLFVSHKDVWQMIYDYYKLNREVPTANVVHEVFPSFDYIDGLEGTTRHYLRLLREARAEQRLRAILEGCQEDLNQKNATASELLGELTSHISEIQRASGMSKMVDVRDVESANKEFNRRRELAALHGGQVGIPTGFKYFDEHYATGFAPGHFGVGIGYSGLGKTWFIIKLAINAWENGYKPMIINLEMSEHELRDRILFLISHYSMDDLVRAELDEEEFTRWAEDYMKDKVPFYLISNDSFGAFTTDMVAGKIEQYKPDIVFCDYLQLFYDRAMTTADVPRARATAREFKELATATQLPIVVISAVTGKDKKDRLVAPSLAQVAWSSEIEYAANIAFAVHTHRDEKSKKAKETEIVGLKNRHGDLFSFNIDMDLVNGTITEIEPDDQLQWQDENQDDELVKLMNS